MVLFGVTFNSFVSLGTTFDRERVFSTPKEYRFVASPKGFKFSLVSWVI
jgi:hypothetical protein